MRLQLSILFLIAFSSVSPFASASQAVQEAEEQPEIALEPDMPDEWKEFGSLFNPINFAEKIQSSSSSSVKSIWTNRTLDAPFMSNLFGIPLTGNLGVQPEAQASPNPPDNGPEFLQRGLETLFSEESSKIIRSFETMINSTVALSKAFHDILESASSNRLPPNIAPFYPLLKQLATFVTIAHDDFRTRFPLPAMAPGHAERAKHVSDALEQLQRLVIRVARNHEIRQELVEPHLARVKPLLHEVGVLIGDVVELYPTAIEALVLNLSAVLLPEAVFLRSLVILYCFGPYVLGKDAIGGWLLKHVSETLRF